MAPQLGSAETGQLLFPSFNNMANSQQPIANRL